MPTYQYEAVTEEGKLIRGVVDAENENLALIRLRDFRYTIRSLEKQTRQRQLLLQFLKIKPFSLALFTRELAAMVNAGLPIMKGFDILSRKGDDRKLEDVVFHVRESVKGGMTLSASLAKHPGVFSPMYISLIRAGEISGELPEILDRLASFLEKEIKLQRKVRAAMTYPILVFFFALTVAALMVLYIFPRFMSLFEGLHLPIPMTTRILMMAVDLFRNPIMVSFIMASAGTAIFFASQYFRTHVGKRQLHRVLLELPLIGPVNRKVAVARFCRTFATLFSSGVPLLTSLDVVGKVSGNEVINDAIDVLKEEMRFGSTLSVPLAGTGLFPPMVTGMIEVGEQTGYLHQMLNKIAEYYETEVEYALDALTKLVEPVLVGFMGLVVGYVVIAVLSPLYQLVASFGR